MNIDGIPEGFELVEEPTVNENISQQEVDLPEGFELVEQQAEDLDELKLDQPNKDKDDLLKSKASDFDKGIFKMAEREAYDKYKETGEIDIELLPEESLNPEVSLIQDYGARFLKTIAGLSKGQNDFETGFKTLLIKYGADIFGASEEEKKALMGATLAAGQVENVGAELFINKMQDAQIEYETESMLDDLEQGNLGQFSERLVGGVVESLPSLLMAAAGPGGLIALGSSSSGMKFDELIKESPEEGLETIMLNSVLSGTAEAAFELATRGLLKKVKLLKSSGNTDAAKELIDGFANSFTNKFILRPFGEGVSEASTRITTGIIDDLTLEKEVDWNQVFKEATEEGLIGTATGGGVVATGALKNSKQSVKNAAEYTLTPESDKQTIIKAANEIDALTKQIKETQDQEDIDILESEIAAREDIITNTRIKVSEELNMMQPDELKKYAENKDEIQKLQKSLSRTKPQSVKEITIEKLEQLETENESLIRESVDRRLNENIKTVGVEDLGRTVNDYNTKEEYQKAYDNTEEGKKNSINVTSSDGFISEDGDIYINKEVAQKVRNVNVAAHELLHGIINNNIKEPGQLKQLVNEFKAILPKEAADKIQKRIDDNYRFTTDEQGNRIERPESEYMEEYFTAFADLIGNRQIKFNENIFTKVGEKLTPIFKGKGYSRIKFDSGKDVYNFIRDYQKQIARGQLAPETIEAAKKIEKQDVKMSKTASDKVQEIYNNQGTAGALDIIQEFKPIVNKIVQRRSEAPGFDRQLLTDEIETGERGILDLIQAYDPESGVPLAAYINKFLPSRAIEASKRVLGEVFEGDIAERVDIAEPTTEVEEVEITEKPKAPTNLRRALDIKEGSDLYNKVKDVVAKTFGTRIPEVTDPKFKKTLQDTYATELTNDVKELMGKPSSDKYKTFLQKYGEQIYDLIPQDILNKSYQDFIVEEKKNLSPTEVDDAISKGLLPSDTPRTAGPSLFTKKPYNQEEFVEFHLAPKKGRPASKQTQLAQTIAKELGKDATLEVLEDPKVFERFTEVQEIEGRKVTKETKPKVAEKIQREPGVKFSKSKVEKTTNKFIEEQAFDKVSPEDFAVHDKRWAFKVSNDLKQKPLDSKNENDVKEFQDWTSNVLTKYFQKDFFSTGNLANAGKSAAKRNFFFTSALEISNKIKNSNFAKENKYISAAIQRVKYTSGKTKLKDGFIKTFESDAFKKEQADKIRGLKEIFLTFEKMIKDDINNARFIAAMLSSTSNSQNHFIRTSAPVKFYSKQLTDGVVEEHTLPASIVAKYLFSSAVNGTVSEDFKNIENNYFQGALSKADDNKLKGRKPNGKPFNYTSKTPEGWKLTDDIWARYFNVNVATNEGGIDPINIILQNGKNIVQEFGVDASGNATTAEIEELKNNSKILNEKELSNNVVKFSKGINNAGVIGYAKTVDEALANARKLDAPVKKIRVFDFDDTLAETKSLVFYNKPSDTKTVKPKLKAIVMAGPPGGGKSSIIKGLGLVNDGFKEVNQDISLEWLKTKEGLPAKESDYTKEQKSMRSKLGAQARKIAARKLDKFAKQGDGIILDGTGASVAATEAKIQALEELGYEVSMIYVNTPKETAIARNQARKERSLPDFIVEKTWDAVDANRNVYAGRFGDKFYEINTEGLKQGEVPQEVSSAIRSDLAAEERGRLTAEEFAKQGKDLVDQGFVMDFSDFNIVREGERGPLFDVAKKIRDARGNEDLFVLTARAPESADAIYEFLKSEGLEFKRENIIGLGNSTGAAKANWVVDKAAEGYNDFYFADDAYANVQAVQDALDQIDVKSKVQQAKVKFSKSIDKDFNKIIEQTTGIASEKRYSKAKAKVRGAGKGNKKFFIPYSAEDFMGLIYPLLSKGSLGDSQMSWFKEHVLDPYGRAIENLSSDRIQMMQDFKELKKSLEVPKDLRKKTESGFTNEQAVRVYLFNKVGHEVPGLSETDLKELIDIVNSDGKLKAFADQILSVTKGDGYVKPAQEWLAGTITTDLIDLLNTTKRRKYLEQSGYLDNVNEIFSEENLNKLEAAYGAKYREAMENILARMKSGKNRMFSGSRLSNRVLDYINGSIGTIMFFNTRSAVLQTISSINFLNWSFNNPIKAGKAFANQKQYWKDFKMLMNSDYLTDRRNGLKLNISENEIANAAATAKNKARGAMNYILQKGYLPTQFADSFAIASGGATFYRNRINDLVDQGMDIKEAEKQALSEWKETAEISQQSSDPSKISQQQASDLGRVILAFANTPMQYARIQKRAIQDLANRRGDAKTNVSKIIYYGVVQNLIFNALQQAVFAIGFGDDDDEDKEKKYISTANGMLDSTLRGLGIAGATTAVIKNFLLDIYERSGRKRPEYVDAVYKLLALSPPISSKISKVRQAAYQFDSKKRRKEIFKKGFSINNPAYEAGAKVISATTNLPLDRVLNKINNIEASIGDDSEVWQKVAMLAGWPEWQIMDKKFKSVKKSSSRNSGRTVR